jgi:hypothetical protein
MLPRAPRQPVEGLRKRDLDMETGELTLQSRRGLASLLQAGMGGRTGV